MFEDISDKSENVLLAVRGSLHILWLWNARAALNQDIRIRDISANVNLAQGV